jgi:hypothetical protein
MVDRVVHLASADCSSSCRSCAWMTRPRKQLEQRATLENRPSVQVGLKFDDLYAELRRDIPLLMGVKRFDEVIARLAAHLYFASDSALFRALAKTDDELFMSARPTAKSEQSVARHVMMVDSPLHLSLASAAVFYATAVLQKVQHKGRVSPISMIPDLLPGLAMCEIHVRFVGWLLRNEQRPEAHLLETLGNVHLFYRTAYASFLCIWEEPYVQWIKDRWELIETACREYYQLASDGQKQTFDNIFAGRGTAGNMIAAVAALPRKESMANALGLLVAVHGERGFSRRLDELCFVGNRRADQLWDGLYRALRREGDPLAHRYWFEPASPLRGRESWALRVYSSQVATR